MRGFKLKCERCESRKNERTGKARMERESHRRGQVGKSITTHNT